MTLRFRETSQSPVASRPIGKTDLVCLTPGSSSVSFYPPGGLTVMGDYSEGEYSCVTDESHGRPPYYTGGPLFIAKFRFPTYAGGGGSFTSKAGICPPGASTHNGFDGSDWRFRYSGQFALNTAVWGVGSLGLQETVRKADDYNSAVNPNDMSSLGNVAYNKLRPKVAVANLFQSLYEAKDISGSLKTSLKGFTDIYRAIGGKDKGAAQSYGRADPRVLQHYGIPSKIGGHYLNHVFGWAPTVQDVTNVCDVVLNFSDHVAKMKRQNDRWLQRKFAEDKVESETNVYSVTGRSDNFCTPYMDSSGYVVPGSASLHVTRQKMTRIWYEGSFKQYLPEFDDSLMSGHPHIQKAAQAIDLLGLNINPVNIYKVMPWTWLGDWFVNVSGNIQAAQDFVDGSVVSRYMYIMREMYDRYALRVRWSAYDGQSFDYTWYRSIHTKRRDSAGSPFGFTLLPGGLNGGQLAILGALGLTLGK